MEYSYFVLFSFVLHWTNINCCLVDYFLSLSASRCPCRRRAHTMRCIRTRPSLSAQWYSLQRGLARSQQRHHQLRQFFICHAHCVPMHHHGGLDRRSLLGNSPNPYDSLLNIFIEIVLFVIQHSTFNIHPCSKRQTHFKPVSSFSLESITVPN